MNDQISLLKVESSRIDYFFNSAKDYIKLVESHFQNDKEKINETYDKENINRNELIVTTKEHPLDIFIEDMLNQYNFIFYYRRSVIIQLYSFLETELKEFCFIIERYAINISKYQKEDHKSEIVSCVNYINCWKKIDLAKINSQWNFLEQLRFLRNAIIHNNSIIHNFDIVSKSKTKKTAFDNIRDLSVSNFSLTPYNYPLNETEKESIRASNGQKDYFEIVLTERVFLDTCLIQIQDFLKNSIKALIDNC